MNEGVRRDRRMVPRVAVILDVLLDDERATTENVSFYGLFAKTARARRVADILPTKILVPGGAICRLVCVVAHRRAEVSGVIGVGLRLVQPKDSTSQEWFGMVERIGRLKEKHPEADAQEMRALLEAGELPGKRRATPRIPKIFLVRPSSMEGLELLRTRELRQGWIFLRSAIPPVEGSEVQAVLVHPETKARFSLEGEVVRVDRGSAPAERGFVMRFLTLGEETREAFRMFMKTGKSARPPLE